MFYQVLLIALWQHVDAVNIQWLQKIFFHICKNLTDFIWLYESATMTQNKPIAARQIPFDTNTRDACRYAKFGEIGENVKILLTRKNNSK